MKYSTIRPCFLYHLTNRVKQCPACESPSFGPRENKQKAVIIIQLQDEQKQNNLENLSVVLFDDDTYNIRNGEKVFVTGHVKVIQQRSQSSKRVSYLFADRHGLKYERPGDTQVTITKRDLALLNKLVKRPDYLDVLAKMVAPTIIGEYTPKLGIIVMYVGAPETEDFRGRIHGLFAGPPGTAKSKIAWQAKKIGDPNSRYSSMEGSSGQSLGVIIDRDGNSYITRSGILVQAKNSMAVLNEVGALLEDDQKHLLSVMEEGIIPKDKYGFHKEIEAKTTILGTLNPRKSDWHLGQVSKDQIPLRRELVDRYDLVFAFRDETGLHARKKYGYEKLAILQKSLNNEIDSDTDYKLLRKLIQHAKTFNPTRLTEEAHTMIVEFFANLNTINFQTKRVLDVATRVSMAFARLHFSEVVTAEIAKKALDFLAKVFKDFDDTVVVIEDPREIVCREIANFYFQRPNMPYDFNDSIEVVKQRSSMLEGYLGDGKAIDFQSHKIRDLRERFLESPPVVQGLIVIENHNPLRLIFKPQNVKSNPNQQQQQN
jgi:DNA replicative helicase MCM subunit Mcm2 (Cdc46/Mcm family)